MARVYSNAELTMSASRASSAGEGFMFLTSDAADPMPGFETPTTLGDGSVTTLKARTAICNRTHHYKPDKARDTSFPPLPEDPLNTRAWTLREGLLSTRTFLLFSQQEIEWQCRSKRTCQCGYLDSLEHETREISPFRLDPPTHAFSFWQKMIEQNYSKRRLPSDPEFLLGVFGR